MKRIIISRLLVTVLMGALLCGCNREPKVVYVEVPTPVESVKEETKEDTETTDKEESSDENKTPEEKHPVKMGVYVMEHEEEIEGEMIKTSKYLFFKEDGKGIYVGQDDITFEWDEDKITMDGGNKAPYTVSSDNILTLENDGNVEEYKYLGETLPEEVTDKMRLDLDGNEKVSDMEAADEFNYIINSDSIDFYDYEGNISYSATGSDKNDMSAAYFELTEDKRPILLIKTPGATHAVGYTHALEYVGGKVYNSIGLDDVSEIYKNAGIINFTYTGGGYGETNYHYYGFDEEGFLSEIAVKQVMEDSEYAKDYEENFGEKFLDTYIIYKSYNEAESVSKEEFEKWLVDMTNSEEPIKDIKWKKLDRAFYFNIY